MMKKSHSTRHSTRASHSRFESCSPPASGLRARLFGAGSERGIALIMVAIQILVLTALSAFVLDYGMLWLGRRQAQNAADAGALSGALARGYDDFGSPPSGTGLAAQSAEQVAMANLVWRAAATPR